MRWLPFLAVSAVFFLLALSNDVYELTSPPEFGVAHVLLRKLYSVGAFAIVGVAYAYARRRSGIVEAAAAVGLYSGLIEIAQWFTTHEPLRWNLIDVGCGIVGGALAGALVSRVRAARGR
jgi:hypothetical protein